MYPTTSPSTSVMAMSVRGVTSPSMLKAVRASRTATLNEVHPRHASFPMRLARLSPTRCQNSTTPSAPAFSIMSSIREARATSITSDLRPSSYKRAQHLLQVGPPFFLGFRGDRIALEVPQTIDQDRQESVPVRRRHVRRGRADLVVRHRDDFLEGTRPDQRAELRLEVLGDFLVLLELLRLAELLDEQDAREPLQLACDGFVVGGEDLWRDRPGLVEMTDDDRRLHDIREDALHLRDLDGLRRQEHQECAVPDAGDDDRAGLELLDGHHHVLAAQLAADVGQVALQQIQQPVLARIELVRDRRREDAAIDAGEHRDVEVVLFPGPLQLRLQEMLQVADRVGPHRLVDLARIGHLSAPLQPVRTEQDLQGFLRRVVVVPVLLHPLDPLDDAGGGLHRLRGLDRLVRLRVLLDGAQDDAELLERVEQLANQLALLELLRGRPDDRRHWVDHDARLDVVVRACLDELRQLLLDHLLELAALEMDEKEALLVVLAHVEAHEVGLAHDLFRRFLEGDVQRLFALLDAFHQELNREGRFPSPARAQDDDGRLGPESAFDQNVESGNPARYFLDVRHGHVPPDRRSLDREGGASLGRMRDSMPAAF